MIDPAAAIDISAQLDLLEREACSDWSGDYDHEALARLARLFVTSSRLDLARVDQVDIREVRALADYPATYGDDPARDDAQLWAAIALCAINEAREWLDVRSGADAYEAQCYLGAARLALTYAAHTDERGRLQRAKAAAAWDRECQVASAFLRRCESTEKWDAKVAAIATELRMSSSTVERLRAQAEKDGLALVPFFPASQ